VKKVTISPRGPASVAGHAYLCDVTVDGVLVADTLVPGQDIVLEEDETILDRVAPSDAGGALHFRIVYPEHLRGRLHAGDAASRVYVTFPGESERLMPRVVQAKAKWPLDGVVSVDVTFAGTVEVEYRDEL